MPSDCHRDLDKGIVYPASALLVADRFNGTYPLADLSEIKKNKTDANCEKRDQSSPVSHYVPKSDFIEDKYQKKGRRFFRRKD